MRPPPLSYAIPADVFVTRDEMARMLEKHPSMSPATRALLMAGCATFTLEGVAFLAPAQVHDGRPTHHRTFKVELASTKGNPQC